MSKEGTRGSEGGGKRREAEGDGMGWIDGEKD